MTVLVAAASKYGATAEIAEAIGRGLRETGVAADVRPVEQVGDLSGYTEVVLGSAVYVGRWLEPARRSSRSTQTSWQPGRRGCSPAVRSAIRPSRRPTKQSR